SAVARAPTLRCDSRDSRTSEGCEWVAITLRDGGHRRHPDQARRYTPSRLMTRRSPTTRAAPRRVVRETTQASPSIVRGRDGNGGPPHIMTIEHIAASINPWQVAQQQFDLAA